MRLSERKCVSEEGKQKREKRQEGMDGSLPITDLPTAECLFTKQWEKKV